MIQKKKYKKAEEIKGKKTKDWLKQTEREKRGR